MPLNHCATTGVSFSIISLLWWAKMKSSAYLTHVRLRRLSRLPLFPVALYHSFRSLPMAALTSASMPCSAILARRGDITPPTKLQTFFFEVRIARVRIDSKDDIDLVLGYFDPLHEGPDEVPFVRPIRSLQAMVDVGRKVFQTANDQLQFCVHGRLICQLLALLLQPGDTLAQAGQPGRKFERVDAPLRVTVDDACDPLPQLADLR